MKIYVAVNDVWTSFGSNPIDPTPDVSPHYPNLTGYPAWGVFPGTGA